jgi:hypothetical protein
MAGISARNVHARTVTVPNASETKAANNKTMASLTLSMVYSETNGPPYFANIGLNLVRLSVSLTKVLTGFSTWQCHRIEWFIVINKLHLALYEDYNFYKIENTLQIMDPGSIIQLTEEP